VNPGFITLQIDNKGKMHSVYLQTDNFGKPKSQWTSTHLDRAVTAIRSCGVGFSVWQTKEGKYEWVEIKSGC